MDMAEAHGRDCWNHTSAILAMIANVNRDPKKGKAFKPSDFNPHVEKQRSGIPLTSDNLSILKTVFVDRGVPK